MSCVPSRVCRSVWVYLCLIWSAVESAGPRLGCRARSWRTSRYRAQGLVYRPFERDFLRMFPRQLAQLFHRVSLCFFHECERMNVLLFCRQPVLYGAVALHQLKFVGWANVTWRKPKRGELRPDAASACNRAGFLRWYYIDVILNRSWPINTDIHFWD